MPEDLTKLNDKIYFITEAQLGRISSVIIEDANHEYQTGFFGCIRSQTLSAHDTAIRNAVLDELGVLHGEDAKRFNEQLDHPEPLTPEAHDLVMQAKRIASEKLPDRCRYWGKKEGKFVCAFLIPDPDLYEELTKRHDDEIINKLLDDLGAYLDAWRTQDPFIGIGMLKHYIQHYLRPITPNQGEENRDGD